MFGRKHKTKLAFTAAVFFCTSGWICSNPAIAADDVGVTGSASVFEDGADDARAVRVTSLGDIDLHVKDLDLSKVLQLLSIQAQRNIVASRNVAGTVTADLYQVDFYEALDAILHPNGFGYQEKGNFIYVYTQQELAAIQEAERRTVTHVMRLSYITATDASTFASPLLSQAGSIAISGEASPGFEASTSDGGANNFAQSETLVIRDYPDNVEEIVKLIKGLDVRPKQVMIEATILEASLSEDNALGVDVSVLADFGAAEFATPLGAVGELISGAVGPAAGGNYGGAATTSVGGTSVGTSGIKVGIVHDNFAVFVRALDQVTDTTVLANPKLLVLNRQRANLLVGERLGYVSSTATDTSTTQTVEFLDTGTSLMVRPFVGEDDFIRLEIKPSISTGTVTELAGFVVPSETTEELTTNVMVRTGQTVVLGGLFKETTTVTRKQVPFLGDVPVLGAAFRGQDDSVDRNEFIFMITPSVVKDESLYAAGERAHDTADLAQIGARQSLLPWSRSKMTAGHVRDAMRHMDAGHSSRALWSANMALALDHTSWEARRVKEQITGKRLLDPKRSILQDAVDQMIDETVEPEAAAAPADAQPQTDVQADADEPTAEAAEPVAQAPATQPVEAAANTPLAVSDDQAVIAPADLISEPATTTDESASTQQPENWTSEADQQKTDDYWHAMEMGAMQEAQVIDESAQADAGETTEEVAATQPAEVAMDGQDAQAEQADESTASVNVIDVLDDWATQDSTGEPVSSVPTK